MIENGPFPQRTGGVPTDDDLIAALAYAFNAPEATAIAWLSRIHVRFNAKAAQDRLVEREASR